MLVGVHQARGGQRGDGVELGPGLLLQLACHLSSHPHCFHGKNQEL